MKAAQPNTRIKTLIVTNIKETLPPLMRILFTLAREKKDGFRLEGGLAGGDIWMKDLLRRYKPSQRPKLEVGPEDTALFQYPAQPTGASKGTVVLPRNAVS